MLSEEPAATTEGHIFLHGAGGIMVIGNRVLDAYPLLCFTIVLVLPLACAGHYILLYYIATIMYNR